MASENGWYGFDLDGSLAKYESGDFRKYGWRHIGEPIEPLVNIAKKLIADGKNVKICTARVCEDNDRDVAEITTVIQDWTEKHIGVRLEVTNEKDFEMIALFDDRAVQVMPNEGILVENIVRALIEENVRLTQELETLKENLRWAAMADDLAH